MLIFGYGSLVNVEHLQAYLGRTLVANQDFMLCRLQDYCRCWTAAMDNRINLPGYKFYVEKHSGNRPQGVVTFLNIRPCSGKTITGIVFDVSEQELQRLDLRERNYRKVDVSDMIDSPTSRSIYAYVGRKESDQRYQQGLEQKSAIISRDYYDLVYGAYKALGAEALADYMDTTDPPQIPIVDLEKCPVTSTQE
ncbi:MAG: gamma-glutamylcyclotransferase family protein [Cyanobacteria bacterium P01_F01_bin.150]